MKLGEDKDSPVLSGGNGPKDMKKGRFATPLSFKIPKNVKHAGDMSKGGKGRNPKGFDGMPPPPLHWHLWAANNPYAPQVHSELSYCDHGSRPQNSVTSWLKVRGSARSQNEPVDTDVHCGAAMSSNGRPVGVGVQQNKAVAPAQGPAQAPLGPKEWLREMEREWAANQGYGRRP